MIAVCNIDHESIYTLYFENVAYIFQNPHGNPSSQIDIEILHARRENELVIHQLKSSRYLN